ncbi:interferon alpha/beta receptor 1b-like isoform 2-T2 [Clarias gariepinus]|uniref:interferon alpha/beta receptor 1b-like n=1 Tax=Clarias gariepinus TaxID=13013 RepID=UPI00234E320C|nr:interferon alpha/beta receptor 1b-like [Clarias gariepinus]
MTLLGAVLRVVVVLLCVSAGVCAVLPVPQNVTLHALNMNYVLKWRWDPDLTPDSASNVTFTAQYIAKFKLKRPKNKQNWTSVCESTSERVCDFTSVDLHYLGMWVLRVRAQSGKNASSWVKTEFCPDQDAAIGPPSALNVTPVSGLLQVTITDPLTIKNSSMKEYLPNMYYLIEYWKRSPLTEKPHNNITTTNNLVILPDLESWTWYCVRVKSLDDYYRKQSVFSPTYCTQTDGQTPYWQIVLYFLLSLVLCFLMFLALCLFIIRVVKIVKSTFYPSVLLPAHFHEYLCDPGSSETPHLLSTESELEICCDSPELLIPDPKVPFVPEVSEVILEVHLPPRTVEPGIRSHSRHSSCDSGVHSMEGSSQSQRQSEFGEVKMEKLGKTIRMDELDEGVQDVIV